MYLHLGPDDARIPAILELPERDSPVPAALLIHGLGATKEQMTGSIGRALLRRGVATLAVDLPLHGGRADNDDARAARNPVVAVQQWRLALREADHALRYLERRDEIDGRRIGVAGYSLGAYIALAVASSDPSVRAVVLAAGGDVPSDIPFARVARTVFDPRRLVRRLAGRPLLMVNGRWDRRISPALATSLFEAAEEPKELRWYDGGHWPPIQVIDDASDWLSQQLAAHTSGVRRTPRTTAPRKF